MHMSGFFKSPQNRTGLAIWLGTAVTALLQVFLLHQSLSSVDVFGIVVGFIKIIEPETTVTVEQLQQVLTESKMLVKAPSLGEISALAEGAGQLIKDLK